MSMATMFVNGLKKRAILIENIPYMLPTKFRFI